MEIKVLGTGCAKCQKLYETTKRLLEDERVEALLVKVEGLDEIVSHGVMMTPGLMIDGVLKSTGRVPKDKQILEWIRAASGKP